ncbi:MAG: hypothetical protein NTY83_02215 [Candidatus Micrarchaeota archaeon]|nr:hypothetical protein [Candidatus Micrarchaeota archaeon]
MLPNAETMGKAMQEKSWAEIAALARSLQIKLGEEDNDAKNLEARLRVINDIERHEFVEFLRALLAKLKTEKIKSGTPHKATFARHKK